MRYLLRPNILAVVLVWNCLFAAAPAAENDDLPPSLSVSPVMYATGFERAAGPAVDNKGNLFVANYRGNGNIGRITPDGGASIFCNLDTLSPVAGRKAQANGLKLDLANRLIVADTGGGRLLRIAADGGSAEVLAERCKGQRFGAIQDVALDAKGNIFFSDTGDVAVTSPAGVVYRFDIVTKKVTPVASKLTVPTGLGISPNQKQLVVAESQPQRLLAFDLMPDGTAVNQRVLCEFPGQDEGEIRGGKFAPGGLVFDEKSRCYVTMQTGGLINVVDLAAKRVIRQYDAGGKQVTNAHFHGEYLYLSVADKEAVFRLKLGVKGFRYVQDLTMEMSP